VTAHRKSGERASAAFALRWERLLDAARQLVAYRGGSKTNEAVVSQAHKALRIHLSLTLAFVCGAFVGAFGFKYIGFAFTLPLALIVAALAAAPSLRQPSADKVVSLNL